MEKLIKMYLDYVNKFLTVEKFAEWYGLDVADAETVIDLGKNTTKEK